MKMHPADSVVASFSCMILKTLALNTAFKVAIKAAGGIAVAIAAKKNPPDVGEVHILADALLAMMICEDIPLC